MAFQLANVLLGNPGLNYDGKRYEKNVLEATNRDPNLDLF